MFGKKKEITQKFIVKTDEELEDFSSTDPKREKTKNSIQSSDDKNFIYYGTNNKFLKQVEIYAVLKDDSNKSKEDPKVKNQNLIAIVVDSNLPLENLPSKICETLINLTEYKNLEGLTAKNLKKRDEDKPLSIEGTVGDVLRNGDIIYFDLVSNEIWIKVNISIINILNKNKRTIVTINVKIKNDLSFREFRYKIIKYTIISYLEKFGGSEHNLHYIISQVSLWHSEHGTIDEDKLKIFEAMRIKQLFKFKDTVKLEIKFYPLEFILFQNLKTLPIQKKLNGKSKQLWERFKALRFKDLLTSKVFIKEKEYIFNHIKNILKDKTFTSNCYIYSLDNDVSMDAMDEGMDDKSEKKEDDLSNINSNLNNTSESYDNIELENISKRNKSVYQGNKSIVNRSSRTQTIYDTTNNNINLLEEDKYILIVIPPASEEEEEEQVKFNIGSLNNKIYSPKNLNLLDNNELNDIEYNINEVDEDDESDTGVSIKKNRRNSYLKKNTVKSKQKIYGTLDFELLEKKDLLEDDEEMIVYKGNKDNKPKQFVKRTTQNIGIGKKKNLKNNLWIDFFSLFDKNKFLDYISGLYLMNIKKGSLEKCTIPICNVIKIEEKKITATNIKKRKKKKTKFASLYMQVFPNKRINAEITILSIFILGIFIYFSYLTSNTFF